MERGSQAEKAGLKPGDIITRVDGKDVSGKPIKEVDALLNAASVEKLAVSLRRDGKAVELVVDEVEKVAHNIHDRLLPGNIAYIKLDNFSEENTAEELQKTLKKYANASGYIIDVRDNPGGYLEEGYRSAELFIDKGPLLEIKRRVEAKNAGDAPEYTTDYYQLTPEGVTISNKQNGVRPEEEARLPDLVRKPTVVLINGQTASAAEIFASALQDNHAATLVGTPSFGKGIGQTVFKDMPADSWLKVTTFEYHTAAGKWLGDGHNDRRPIQPDKRVVNFKGVAMGGPADAQLKYAREFISLQSSQKK